MKKFFCCFLTLFFCVISCVSLSGCASEVDKASKNLTSYAISAVLDAESMQIEASEEVIYYNSTGESLDYICFHLYPRAFREDATIKPYTSLTIATCFPNGESFGDILISSVEVNGEAKQFELAGEDEDILKIEFGFSLLNKKTASIKINFTLTIPNCTHRLGYYEGNINLGNWYPIACVFSDGEFDTSPYYSTGDPFVSDVANYSVTLTYPSNYALCSTGEISSSVANSSASDNATTATISARAVRDFAMCLSNSSSVVSTMAGGTTIFYMGYSDDSDLQKLLTISREAVSYFSEIFGDYPYSTLSVAKTPFVFGGMEYPNMVFVSDSIDDDDEVLKVIVHEIAHQWWYAVVGNNEITEAWLDESLAEYSTALFFEEYSKYGISYDDFVQNAMASYLLYVDVISTIRGEVNTKMDLAVYEYQNDYEYSYMVYVKGVIMFDSLRSVVGKNKLIAGLAKYYSDNKFQIATKDDFLTAFKSACHKDLEGFFDGYLNGTVEISNIN